MAEIMINPNGESSVAATLAASDKRHVALGLSARLLSACPVPSGLHVQ